MKITFSCTTLHIMSLFQHHPHPHCSPRSIKQHNFIHFSVDGSLNKRKGATISWPILYSNIRITWHICVTLNWIFNEGGKRDCCNAMIGYESYSVTVRQSLYGLYFTLFGSISFQLAWQTTEGYCQTCLDWLVFSMIFFSFCWLE